MSLPPCQGPVERGFFFLVVKLWPPPGTSLGGESRCTLLGGELEQIPRFGPEETVQGRAKAR